MDRATHVYIKLDKTTPLSKVYDGPFPIISRPTKSTITIREGFYVSGIPMLKTHHWQSAKIANMRPEAQEGHKPTRGRPPKSASTNTLTNETSLTYPNRSDDISNINKPVNTKLGKNGKKKLLIETKNPQQNEMRSG